MRVCVCMECVCGVCVCGGGGRVVEWGWWFKWVGGCGVCVHYTEKQRRGKGQSDESAVQGNTTNCIWLSVVVETWIFSKSTRPGLFYLSKVTGITIN